MGMERVKLNDTLELSRIVYGMWRIGDESDTSPAHVQAKIDACLAQGITTMDQADIYGGYTAEAILGAAFQASPGLRDKVELVTKCDIVAPMGRYQSARVKHYNTSRTHILASVEHSLLDMKTDRIDLLLIHRPDPFMDHHETGKALDELVTSGKVRAVGVSNFKLNDWTLLQSAMSTKLCTNQVELSVLNHAPLSKARCNGCRSSALTRWPGHHWVAAVCLALKAKPYGPFYNAWRAHKTSMWPLSPSLGFSRTPLAFCR